MEKRVNRLFGLMPRNEIEIEKTVDSAMEYDGPYYRTLIQSGKNGWTIIYGDASTEYGDVIDTAYNNFKAAIRYLKQDFPFVRESKDGCKSEPVMPDYEI
jgi:hypothetical protein